MTANFAVRMLSLTLGALLFASAALGNGLANGGFEGASPTTGLPSGAGSWTGDIATRVFAQNGITPAEGSAMLRFEAAYFSCPTGGTGSDLWQLVPVGANATTAHLNAKFNRVTGGAQTDRRFVVGIRAQSGVMEDFDASTSPPPALASNTNELDSDGNVTTWQPVSLDFVIPAGTTYLAVLISAVEDVSNGECPNEFDGHYADDVSLTIDTALPGFPPAGIPLVLVASAIAVGMVTRRTQRT